jgi:hypothetical protein
MIEVVGVNQGSEYEAALHLRRLLLNLWPDLAQNRSDIVKIFVGLKLYGYRIEDLDLVIIGQFSEARSFDVELPFTPRSGESFVPRNASIRNFALVVEVKSHDPTGVRFDDKVAFVRYMKRGAAVWDCATEQNRQQMFEFKRYLADQGISRIYVQDLILFMGLKERDLPSRPHNFVGVDASFERILNVLGQIAGPNRSERSALLQFGSVEVMNILLDPNFPMFRTLLPTPIDRSKMDRIAKNALPADWLEEVGEKHILVRGRGGVGKTVILLQMAYKAFDLYQRRSLILTFNKALVADMRRTMALMGVPRNIENGGIVIDTVHSFIGRTMIALGIINNYEGFIESYEKNKDLLVSYIEDGAVSTEDLKKLQIQRPNEFWWDLVFVDEGQDWPRNEIYGLRAMYGAKNLVVSDGVDQFVRESVADWSVGVDGASLRTRHLIRSLRMKANIALFALDVAKALQLDDWNLEPNYDATGGRVIIVEGELASDCGLFSRLRSEALALGNYPIDMLACVPPSLVSWNAESRGSVPGMTIAANGNEVWDATALDIREHYPTSREALRIVQYDSCRGLEGWAVINYGLDELWDYKYQQWLVEPHAIADLYQTKAEAAAMHAARWIMIPITRAMDTLVINVSKQDGTLKNALRGVHLARGDFVEWLTI